MKIYAKPWLASACSISFHSALIQFEVMAATSGSVVLLVGRVIALPNQIPATAPSNPANSATASANFGPSGPGTAIIVLSRPDRPIGRPNG